MVENLRISWRGIWSHKIRSFLTMLGIVIGIAAIITLISIMQGSYEKIKENLIGLGNNLITVNLHKDGWEIDPSSEEMPIGRFSLDDRMMENLLQINHVEAVSFFHARSFAEELYYKNVNVMNCSVRGIDRDYLNTSQMQIMSGRGFSNIELQKSGRVCLLDQTAVDEIIPDTNPLGETLYLKRTPFTIIGIVRNLTSREPVINSIEDYYMYAGDSMGTMMIPDSSWPLIYQYDEPQQILVRAENTDSMTKVGQDVASLLNDTLMLDSSSQDKLQYRSNDLLKQAEEIREFSSTSNMMLIAVASISLIVGGIGVMNIMLVSVTERTREIGLKKAIGATRKQILVQFLTESILLSAFGGVIGIVTGIILSYLFSRITGIPVAINLFYTSLAFGFSALVGIISGIIPSRKAAKLNPIDALRQE